MIPRESKDIGQRTAARFRLIVSAEFSRCFGAEPWEDAQTYDDVMSKARSVPGGRSPNWLLELPDRERRVRIRPCRHGGIFGPWFGDRSWSANRVLREFSCWNTLSRQRIPLPVPVFAISRRQGIFWRSAFASIERDDARDGLTWLDENPSSARIAAICVSFAKSTRRLHDAGAIHGDLQVRNLLIESERCLFVDLDRTRIVDRVSPRQRVRELLRLARSLEKTGHANVATRRCRALVLSAYCDGDRRLRRSMIRWARLEALGILRHRIAWRVARLVS